LTLTGAGKPSLTLGFNHRESTLTLDSVLNHEQSANGVNAGITSSGGPLSLTANYRGDRSSGTWVSDDYQSHIANVLGVANSRRGFLIDKLEMIFCDYHVVFGRVEIYAARLNAHPVLYLVYRYFCMVGQQLRHIAFVVRRQVLNDYERHIPYRRHAGEKLLYSFQPPCGCADPDDVKIVHLRTLLCTH
jgi:hypothetical protein